MRRMTRHRSSSVDLAAGIIAILAVRGASTASRREWVWVLTLSFAIAAILMLNNPYR